MGVSPMPSSADTCKELRLCRCPGSESSHYSLHEEMVAKVRFKDAEGSVWQYTVPWSWCAYVRYLNPLFHMRQINMKTRPLVNNKMLFEFF